MRIALVHEFLTQNGGAERVLDAFHELYPTAPIYTSVYDRSVMGDRYARAEIRPSSLQRFYGDRRRYKFALPRFGAAFEEFDFREFDVVLSSSWAFAKGIVTSPETCHICYCHTPARLAWQFDAYVGSANMGGLMTRVLRRQAHTLRSWDVASSTRVDHYIANSHNVAARIRKYYGRDSTVVHAPVNTDRFVPSNGGGGDFYLVVGRMIPYKRIDVAVEAFTRMGKPLKVVGRGPHERRLRAIAGPSVEFVGGASDAEVTDLYRQCRALIFTGEEDFGITPLEAMASGRPVIAYGAGGALETVRDGVTGLLFGEQHSTSLIHAVRRFESMSFSTQTLRKHSECFDTKIFKSKIAQCIDDQAANASRLRNRCIAV